MKKTQKSPEDETRKLLASARNKALRSLSKIDGISFVPVEQLTNVFMRRRPTGILQLDKALGGGYPFGSNVVITGPTNSGKDLLLNLAIRENQKVYGEDSAIAIIQAGELWDKSYARLMGVVTPYSEDELREEEEQLGRKLTPAEKKERTRKLGLILINTPSTQEGAQDIINTLLRTASFQIIIVNSVDGLQSNAEQEGVEERGSAGASDGRGGEGRARLLSEHFRTQNTVMQQPVSLKTSTGDTIQVPIETTIFWITQQRTTHPNKYMSRMGMTGGQALQYWAALILETNRVGVARFMGPQGEKDPAHLPTADTIQVHVQKGKYGIADGQRIEFVYYKRRHSEDGRVVEAGTIDDASSLRIEMLQADLLRRRGNIYTVQLPDREPVDIVGGRLAVDDWLLNHADLRGTIEEALRHGTPPGTESKESLTEIREAPDQDSDGGKTDVELGSQPKRPGRPKGSVSAHRGQSQNKRVPTNTSRDGEATKRGTGQKREDPPTVS